MRVRMPPPSSESTQTVGAGRRGRRSCAKTAAWRCSTALSTPWFMWPSLVAVSLFSVRGHLVTVWPSLVVGSLFSCSWSPGSCVKAVHHVGNLQTDWDGWDDVKTTVTYLGAPETNGLSTKTTQNHKKMQNHLFDAPTAARPQFLKWREEQRKAGHKRTEAEDEALFVREVSNSTGCLFSPSAPLRNYCVSNPLRQINPFYRPQDKQEMVAGASREQNNAPPDLVRVKLTLCQSVWVAWSLIS